MEIVPFDTVANASISSFNSADSADESWEISFNFSSNFLQVSSNVSLLLFLIPNLFCKNDIETNTLTIVFISLILPQKKIQAIKLINFQIVHNLTSNASS